MGLMLAGGVLQFICGHRAEAVVPYTLLNPKLYSGHFHVSVGGGRGPRLRI